MIFTRQDGHSNGAEAHRGSVRGLGLSLGTQGYRADGRSRCLTVSGRMQQPSAQVSTKGSETYCQDEPELAQASGSFRHMCVHIASHSH